MKIESKARRKAFYWLFKLISVAVSGALPIWAIFDKFPLWTETYGVGRSVGAGGIIGILVMLAIFRKQIFDMLRDKWKIKYAPPMTIWIVMIVISYILMFINKFLYDITTVFWMGLIGSLIGTIFTFIGESCFGEGERNE